MKIRTKVAFSGVPEGTTGTIEKDDDEWKVTWDLVRFKPLEDWFDDYEKDKYLEEI